MKIAIIGTGYVGTVAGACFAEAGNEVVCVDQNARKVAALASGDPVIYEPGLEALLKKNIERKRIRFSTSVAEAVRESSVIFLTVGTPSMESGDANLTFLEGAARDVAKSMREPKLVVNKSTVPIGTSALVKRWMTEETSIPFEIASNPEFLREGSAIQDFLYPERVILGVNTTEAFEILRAIYLPFVNTPNSILRMDPLSAELTKYACNAFLATKISFINELARLCDETGADILSIREGMALDGRIGGAFLNAGIGYGGSCFPKDIRALVTSAQRYGVPLRIVESAERANETQKRYLLRALLSRLRTSSTASVVAFWGLAFKPETDDIREASAVAMIETLLQSGAKVRVYDPIAMANGQSYFGKRIEFSRSAIEAIEGADALVIATEWNEFKSIHPLEIRRKLRQPWVYDGRNILDPLEAELAGLNYHGVGRGVGLRRTARSLADRAKLATAARRSAAASEQAVTEIADDHALSIESRTASA